MRITVLCVGRVKESYLCGAIEEYKKRLSKYCKLEIIEVADEKTPEDASDAVREQIKAKEASRLSKYLTDGMYVCVLAIEGRQLSSEEFAKKIDALGVSGVSHIAFVIGGSLGLAPEILARADFLLSFSKMTFPHQLMRVVLLEQVYRGYRIICGEPYHK